MKGTVGAVLLCATLIACNSAKDTSLPHELDKMESNKLAMERLTPEQRELLAGYLMRGAEAVLEPAKGRRKKAG